MTAFVLLGRTEDYLLCGSVCNKRIVKDRVPMNTRFQEHTRWTIKQDIT